MVITSLYFFISVCVFTFIVYFSELLGTIFWGCSDCHNTCQQRSVLPILNISILVCLSCWLYFWSQHSLFVSTALFFSISENSSCLFLPPPRLYTQMNHMIWKGVLRCYWRGAEVSLYVPSDRTLDCLPHGDGGYFNHLFLSMWLHFFVMWCYKNIIYQLSMGIYVFSWSRYCIFLGYTKLLSSEHSFLFVFLIIDIT